MKVPARMRRFWANILGIASSAIFISIGLFTLFYQEEMICWNLLIGNYEVYWPWAVGGSMVWWKFRDWLYLFAGTMIIVGGWILLFLSLWFWNEEPKKKRGKPEVS